MTAPAVEAPPVEDTLDRLSDLLGVPAAAVPGYLLDFAALAEAAYEMGRKSILVRSAAAAQEISAYLAGLSDDSAEVEGS